MSDAEEIAVSICWECETETDQTITVELPTGPNHPVRLALCLDCYRDCYLTAVPELAATPPASED